MIHLSRRGDVNTFYAMDALAAVVRRKEEGKDVVSMAIGQPSASSPKKVIEAAQVALKTGQINYTDSLGILPLRQRISEYYSDHHGVSIAPSRIVITTGSSAAFNLTFLSYFDVGDTVAIPRPGYPAYRNILMALNINVVEIDTTSGRTGAVTAKELIETFNVTPFKGLIFSSPANPTGASINESEMRELIEAARARNIHIISDEIYHRLNYVSKDVTALSFSEDVTVINSFSKYYCMTGWRIGWMVIPQAAVRNIERLVQSLYISTPELSQIAATAAFDATDELEEIKQGYIKNRAILSAALPQIGFKLLAPLDGAFYAYCDITNFSNDSIDFAQKMLQSTGVATTPGKDFDLKEGNHTMRFSYAGSEADMYKAMDLLQNWLK